MWSQGRKSSTTDVRPAEPASPSMGRLQRHPSAGERAKSPRLHTAFNAKTDVFAQRHGLVEAEEIRRDIKDVSRMLAKRELWSRWVIIPTKNKHLARWDVVTSLALIWTATITPFETAFIPPVLGPLAFRDFWFLSNRCLDVIFGLDMVLQFFVAYQTTDAFGTKSWVMAPTAHTQCPHSPLYGCTLLTLWRACVRVCCVHRAACFR